MKQTELGCIFSLQMSVSLVVVKNQKKFPNLNLWCSLRKIYLKRTRHHHTIIGDAFSKIKIKTSSRYFRWKRANAPMRSIEAKLISVYIHFIHLFIGILVLPHRYTILFTIYSTLLLTNIRPIIITTIED